MSSEETAVVVGGPYYDELTVGQVFDSAPGVTLTDGLAAAHRAILGDRLRLTLDKALSEAVVGPGETLVHPGLVCDVAIGQSTLDTHRVIANLFYRGLRLRRLPRVGDTLRTVTEVVALRDNSVRGGRAPTGVAALRIRSTDQRDRLVLDFVRCAMLPNSSETARPGHADDLERFSTDLEPDELAALVDGWDLGRYRAAVPGPHAEALTPGTRYVLETGDTVTGATELVRLSGNIAAVHSDPGASGYGKRLVYGGHTIGIACSQLTKVLPNLLTILAWRSCDHLGPVYEEDVLHSEVRVEQLIPVRGNGAMLVDLRVQTTAVSDGAERRPVLDWRLIGVMAK